MNRPVAYRGGVRVVAYALLSGGNAPGLDFFKSLEIRDQIKMLKLFEMLGERGLIFNKEKFKAIEGAKFYEFKSKRIRMPCYQDGLIWIVTHGFMKKTDKIDPEEIRRAERIKAEDEIICQSGMKKRI